MATFNNPINNTVGGSNSGVTNTFTVTNSSNTASSQANELITVGGGTAGDPFTTYTVSGVTSWSHGIDNSASDAFVLSASSSLGTTDIIQAQTTGEINYPLQPAFLAYLNTTTANVTGDGTVYTIIYDTEVYDQNGDFDLASSTFTAPVTGKYRIDYVVLLAGGTSISTTNSQIVTSNRPYLCTLANAAGNAGAATQGFSVLADMDAADTFTVTVTTTDSGGKIDDLTGFSSSIARNYLSASLVC